MGLYQFFRRSVAIFACALIPKKKVDSNSNHRENRVFQGRLPNYPIFSRTVQQNILFLGVLYQAVKQNFLSEK